MPVPKAEIVGRCLREPVKGTDRNGNPYIFIRVGASDWHKDDQGNPVTDRELFVNIEKFRADMNMRVPEVGDNVRAFGRLYERKDTGDDGTEYRNVVLQADFVESWPKRNQAQQGWGDVPQQPQQGQPQQGQLGAWGNAPADIPGEPPF